MDRFLNLPAEIHTKIKKSMKRQVLKKNTRLFIEGDLITAVFIINSGYVRRTISNGTSREVLISIAGPSETAGELALFNNNKHVVSASTITETTVELIDAADYFWLHNNCPEFSKNTNSYLYEQLTILNSRMKHLSADTVELRLKRFFIYLSNKFGVRDNSKIIIPFKLSRAELAQAVNTTVETATRIMNKWEKQKDVSQLNKQFVISSDFIKEAF